MYRRDPSWNVGLRVDSIEAHAVLTQNPGLRVGRELTQMIEHDPHGRAVVSRECTDWPVGANHEPVGSKGCEDSIEIRVKVFGLPLPPLRFSDHPGEFAADIRPRGQCLYMLAPRRKLTLCDRWLGYVIEDERLLRELLYQLYRGWEMFGKQQQVV